MNLRATQPVASPHGIGGDAKFTYASGSRPLAGYTIKRGIGHGGFGEVYYATSDGGKEVALKLIRRNLDIELRGVSHCLNLKHPHLLALHDVKIDDRNDNWVVMEYVSGDSLEDVLDKHPQGLPVEEAVAWMHGIAAGVACLHDHGIVHRDLKPGNIFFDEGIVKVGDYGLSKFVSCSRRSGQTESVGTVHYMAPEVANGRYGKEIDVYALGIILFEMLTGRVPFEGESVGEVLMKHLTAEPDLSALEEPFRTIVGKCLAKDPSERVKSVQELLDLLPETAPGKMGRVEPKVWATSTKKVETPVDAAKFPEAKPVATDEPILRAVREAGGQLQGAWTKANLPHGAKVAILVACLASLIINRQLLWFFFPILFIYGIYFVIRAIVLSLEETPAAKTAQVAKVQPAVSHPPAEAPEPPQPAAVATPATPVADPKPAVAARKLAPRYGRPMLPKKGRTQRFTELVGSLILSGIVSAVAAFALMLMRRRPFAMDEYLWLALVSGAGAWAILVPSKWWEGSRGDAILRRFVLLFVGLGVGLVAYVTAQSFFVNLPHEMQTGSVASLREMSPFYYSMDAQPRWPAFATYFGLLFVALRWWKVSDPLRRNRLDVWATLTSVFWAWLLSLFWHFPQPWGLMAAATISIAVQIGSPWIDPADRKFVVTDAKEAIA